MSVPVLLDPARVLLFLLQSKLTPLTTSLLNHSDLAQIFERFGPLVRIEIPPAKEADYSYV